MKDLKRGSRLVEDVNYRAWDGMCASVFPFLFFGASMVSSFAGKHGTHFSLVCFSRFHGTYWEWEVGLFFFSFQLATNITGRMRLSKGEGGGKGGEYDIKGPYYSREYHRDTHNKNTYFFFLSTTHAYDRHLSRFLSIVCFHFWGAGRRALQLKWALGSPG